MNNCMYQWRKPRIILLSIMMVMVLLLQACTPSTPPSPIKQVKWEYKVILISDMAVGPFLENLSRVTKFGNQGEMIEDGFAPEVQKRLNDLGAEGWELIGFTGDINSPGAVLIFKRYIP